MMLTSSAPGKISTTPGFMALTTGVSQRTKVERIERFLRQMEQVDLGTTHTLSGAVYVRCIFIPAGTALTGAVHKSDHVNLVWGDISVTTEKGLERFTGWHILSTKAGMKRAGMAHSDTYWATCCSTSETEIEAIEDELVEDAHLLQTRQQRIGHDITEQLEQV